MMPKNLKSDVDQATADVNFDLNQYQIQFETTLGDILLDLWPDVAPQHCRNLIGLVKTGFYDGIIFHRVIKGFVIQGGCPQGSGTGGPGYTIDAEFNDRPHVAGVLSMARKPDPNSAGSQIFICLGTASSLDRQYTAFGKTANEPSLAVVLKIGSVPVSNERPREDVKIKKASVIETAKS